MTILAFDTTSPTGSLALWADGRLIELVPIDSPDGFSPLIFDAIGALLSRHDLTVSDLDAIGVATGPGSFTGVRVGLAAAKGLAEALSIPIAGVSCLQAAASAGRSQVRAVWIDARRGEIYGGLFDAELRPLADEVVTTRERWLATLPVDVEIIDGNGGRLAGWIAEISATALAAGAADGPALLEANYIRHSDAELH